MTEVSEAKLYRVRVVLPSIAGLMHAVQAVIFVWVGWYALAAASVLGVLVFGVALVLIQRGWGRLGAWVAYVEVALHFPLLSTAFGLESGYALYTLPLAMAPFMAFTREQLVDRMVGVTVAVALGAGLLGLDQMLEPWNAVDTWVVEWVRLLNLLGVVFAVVAITAWFSGVAEAAEKAQELERQRSEKLLRNILPAPVAERLKAGEEPIADHFDRVAVLFADLVGFTVLARSLSTTELITLLNELFREFDRLAAERGLEKIKTIGDAYMVVGGLPVPSDDPAPDVAEMGLRMIDATRRLAERTGHPVDLRVGIHVGPVVAGVIGTSKFAYDLWGDVVNTASRMESHGEAGRVQVTEEVAATLSGRLEVEERGVIEVKGKGPMKTFWLSGA